MVAHSGTVLWALMLGLGATAPQVQRKIERAQVLYGALDFGRVIRITNPLVSRRSLTRAQKLELWRLRGSAFVVLRRLTKAETSFRLLLQTDSDYELPHGTSPKILAVFRKVQVEEAAIKEETRQIERRRIVRKLKFVSEHPSSGKGGVPIQFAYQIRDPHKVVSSVRVEYRRVGEPEYASLPLLLDLNGAWEGEIPASWTANDSGESMEYWVTTLDAGGMNLLANGSRVEPLTLLIEPGQMETSSFYKTWWFWSLVGVVVVSAGVATYLGVQGDSGPESDLGRFRAF